jgi:hypothetical protein
MLKNKKAFRFVLMSGMKRHSFEDYLWNLNQILPLNYNKKIYLNDWIEVACKYHPSKMRDGRYRYDAD